MTVIDEGLIWEEPPPEEPRVRRGPWERLLAPLLERPGEWARVRELKNLNSAQATLCNLRAGKIRLAAGRWSFRGSLTEPYIWACYLGPEEEL